jgi:phosphoribosylamine--glycine ligase
MATDPIVDPRVVLVVGSGGREHALAWRLREDGVERVLACPGNPGMSDVAEPHPDVAANDTAGILALCAEEGVDLVVVGPEGPLVTGLVDALLAAGVAAFGPSAAAARIEGSKGFCRDVAAAAGVPMAEGATFDDPAAALAFAEEIGGPIVVKADGLASGKGVVICADIGEAATAIRGALVEKRFGTAGSRVVVERALEGTEASLIAICDSTTALALPVARDHKRIGDGDTGANTGGMGAYSPVEPIADEQIGGLLAAFHRPVLRELARRGSPFRGALYAGLMLTPNGPRLLEFNARFGDPEAQAILPRLGVPLGRLLLAAATDRLAPTAASMGLRHATRVCAEPAACVVLAADGYPGTPRLGDRISGLEEARSTGALVFLAGVAADPDGSGGLVTSGGRVASIVGSGPDLDSAVRQAYDAADLVRFRGRQMRRDIGASALATVGAAS